MNCATTAHKPVVQYTYKYLLLSPILLLRMSADISVHKVTKLGAKSYGFLVRFPSEARYTFFPTMLRQALGPIQPSIQWVAVESFAWGKATPILFQKNGMQNTGMSQ